MTDYRVDEVSLDHEDIERQVEDLISRSFGIDVPPGRLRRNTSAPDRPAPLYVAALLDTTIIGFNAFIGHRLTLNGQEVLAYQSCWTATSREHRGKKIFQNLILAAQEILSPRGVAFVFGFPNHESRPIFVGKLGYRETRSLKWQMPNLPLSTSLFLKGSDVNLGQLNVDAVGQDDRALICLKRNEPLPQVKQFQYGGSLCWGVRRQRKLGGLPVNYVDVGGIELADARHLSTLVSGLARQLPGAAYVQLVSIEGAPYNQLFRNMKSSESNVLIVRDLDLSTTGLRFNFFGGIRDVY